MATSNPALRHWLLPHYFAPFVGSFLGLLILRLPGRVVWGRSACPHCGERLRIRDLVPLLSWLVHRGRCRFCGAALPLFYPAVEVISISSPPPSECAPALLGNPGGGAER